MSEEVEKRGAALTHEIPSNIPTQVNTENKKPTSDDSNVGANIK